MKKKEKKKKLRKGKEYLHLKIENLQIQCLIIDLQIAFSYPPSSAS